MQVVDVDRVVGDVVAEVVGLAVGDAGLDAAAGQPDGEAARVVVAAVVVGGQRALAVDRPAELAAPDDQRVVEQAALLQVGDQGGARAGRCRGTGRRSAWAGCVCWSQPRWKSWMKRTPRSASRRASRQLAAKVPGLRDVGAVQVEDVLAARRTGRSARARDVCMRKAISYWAMRVAISGSPTSSMLELVERGQVVEHPPPASRRRGPAGWTGRAPGRRPERNLTPWYCVGRKPLPQRRS